MNIAIEESKSKKCNKALENKCTEPSYIRYLAGLAILLFTFIIGYYAFAIPDMDTPVNISADHDENFKEEKLTLDNTKININKAKKEELQTLKGVGWHTAEKIIKYRETHGGFSSTKEIMEVSGIGEKSFEKIKDDIIV